jgi:hypothetical protein
MTCSNRINTLTQFREYIKISLGAPVICLELSDDQIDLSIKDSIDYAYRYLYGEALFADYIAFTVSAGVSAYPLDDDIEDAYDITFNNTGGGSLLFDPYWMTLQNNFNFYGMAGSGGGGGMGGGGSITALGQGMSLASAQIAFMYQNDAYNMFGKMYGVKYRENRKELIVTPTPEAGGVGLVSVWRREQCDKLYNHILIRQLAVAKSKKIWATNLKKYSITMPGQSTVNGDVLYQDALIEEDKATDAILSESQPPDFYIA